jgi:hypothetical protein
VFFTNICLGIGGMLHLVNNRIPLLLFRCNPRLFELFGLLILNGFLMNQRTKFCVSIEYKGTKAVLTNGMVLINLDDRLDAIERCYSVIRGFLMGALSYLVLGHEDIHIDWLSGSDVYHTLSFHCCHRTYIFFFINLLFPLSLSYTLVITLALLTHHKFASTRSRNFNWSSDFFTLFKLGRMRKERSHMVLIRVFF